jgi:hypothetical protein
MSVVINIDTSSLQRLQREMRTIQNEIPSAAASALNRTVTYTKTQLSKEIRERYAIKAKDLNGNFKVRKANKYKLEASINSSGRPLTLPSHFNVTPRNVVPGRRYIVRAKIKKRQAQAINTAPAAFIATLRGIKQVVRREGPNRYPIKVLRTLSIPQMASNDQVYDKVERLAKNKLDDRVIHEINWRLARAAQVVH